LVFTELKSPSTRPYGAERGSKYQDQAGPQASRIGGDDEFHGRGGGHRREDATGSDGGDGTE
jgi:dCTP deaminase